jgi:hypothetical protein
MDQFWAEVISGMAARINVMKSLAFISVDFDSLVKAAASHDETADDV